MLLATEICKKLKESSTSKGDKLVEMHKMMMRFNDIVIDCAAKLAPYQNAKLQSVTIDKKVTHRYVIQAPTPIQNKETWLEQVKETTPQIPVFKKQEQGQEAEEVEKDYEYDNIIEARI